MQNNPWEQLSKEFMAEVEAKLFYDYSFFDILNRITDGYNNYFSLNGGRNYNEEMLEIHSYGLLGEMSFSKQLNFTYLCEIGCIKNYKNFNDFKTKLAEGKHNKAPWETHHLKFLLNNLRVGYIFNKINGEDLLIKNDTFNLLISDITNRYYDKAGIRNYTDLITKCDYGYSIEKQETISRYKNDFSANKNYPIRQRIDLLLNLQNRDEFGLDFYERLFSVFLSLQHFDGNKMEQEKYIEKYKNLLIQDKIYVLKNLENEVFLSEIPHVFKIPKSNDGRIFYIDGDDIYHYENKQMLTTERGNNKHRYLKMFKIIINKFPMGMKKLRISEFIKISGTKEFTKKDYYNALGKSIGRSFENFLWKKNGIKNVHPDSGGKAIFNCTAEYIYFNNNLE